MSDAEFDVLDELYFVQSFGQLHQNLNITERVLKQTLLTLVHKGWVKVLKTQDEEVALQEADFDQHYGQYYYLATKAGLLSHNSR